MTMLTTDEQVRRILAGARALPPISVQLLDAHGCFLAVDARARVSQGTDAVFLPAGTRISTMHLPMLVAAGIPVVEVAPKARVVVLTTGTGVVAEANHVLLSSACAQAGAQVYRVVGSGGRATRAVIEDQLVRADVVLVVGDDARALAADLAELGRVDVHDLAVSPVMSLAFGSIGEDAVPVMILPGRPLLTLLAFELFARPLIRTLAADPHPFRPTIRARSLAAWEPAPGSQELRLGSLCVSDGVYAFRPSPDGDPTVMLATSDCFASIPAGVTAVAEGDPVLVVPLDGLPS